ncbi:hypothetical protein BR93DRAFT_202817 [Coniochaeta sp. PMI_546]|nr:hypothetical protein BR93DRAFT_202817 [Coniochaeta sp. PMI_546]
MARTLIRPLPAVHCILCMGAGQTPLSLGSDELPLATVHTAKVFASMVGRALDHPARTRDPCADRRVLPRSRQKQSLKSMPRYICATRVSGKVLRLPTTALQRDRNTAHQMSRRAVQSHVRRSHVQPSLLSAGVSSSHRSYLIIKRLVKPA